MLKVNSCKYALGSGRQLCSTLAPGFMQNCYVTHIHRDVPPSTPPSRPPHKSNLLLCVRKVKVALRRILNATQIQINKYKYMWVCVCECEFAPLSIFANKTRSALSHLAEQTPLAHTTHRYSCEHLSHFPSLLYKSFGFKCNLSRAVGNCVCVQFCVCHFY